MEHKKLKPTVSLFYYIYTHVYLNILCMFHLFEGLPKLSSRSHAQLFCDVS